MREQGKAFQADNKSCVYLSEHGECGKLNVSVCQGDECAFYQSGSDITKSGELWQERMSALDSAQQLKIAKKYYGGRMPWNLQQGKTPHL